MKADVRPLLHFGFILALLLTACTTTVSGPLPSPPPLATLTPLPTATVIVPTAPSPATPVVQLSPSPPASQQSLFPPVTEDDWQQGPANAAVTIVVYSDFQCPNCARVAPMLAQLREEFPDDLRLVFRHFPLPQHNKARLAAVAAEAAGAQGRFWELHDLFFAEYLNWYHLPLAEFRTLLETYAVALRLDQQQFKQDLEDPKLIARVDRAFETARDIPLPGTPFLLFNGDPVHDDSVINYWAMSTLIRLELLKERQYASPPPDIIDPFKTYRATLHTEKGAIVIELFAEHAPLTVNNFVFLAREGWYDEVTFHRVIPGFAAQAGDPSGTGYGGPGYFIPDEIVPELRYDAPGWVGMANSGRNTNGSQFFISMAALPELDGRYPIFGRVVEGLDVVSALTPRDPNADPSLPPGDLIHSVTIEER
jgi:cyclophilin family peptidyl-prolyl cis-trans isomerase/protein-disulfide isomerase